MKRYCIRNGERVSFSELRAGDIAKMYEPDGTPCDGDVSFRVLAAPFQRKDGVWVVDTTNLVPYDRAAAEPKR